MQSDKITIGFTGDFCPWRRIEQAFYDGTWQPLLADAQRLLAANDLNIIDLECPLTKSGTPIVKTGPHLRADPATATLLPWLNCRLVATANNHFADYGVAGMRETYAALTTAGVAWVGSGENLTGAARPHVTTIKDKTFAILNLAENEWTTTQGDAPGCNPLDLIGAYRVINEVRAETDFVIAILHGGHEHYAPPSPRMQREARHLIDLGADAVVYHHSHVVSGYERYREKPIFYGLGNFCFDWGPRFVDHPWNLGMVLHLHFSPDGEIDFSYDLIRQNDGQPGVYLLDDSARERAEAQLQNLNAVIADPDRLAAAFDAYCASLAAKTTARLQPYNNRYLAALHRRGWLPTPFGRRKQTLLTNLVRCESHREVLLNVLTNPER